MLFEECDRQTDKRTPPQPYMTCRRILSAKCKRVSLKHTRLKALSASKNRTVLCARVCVAMYVVVVRLIGEPRSGDETNLAPPLELGDGQLVMFPFNDARRDSRVRKFRRRDFLYESCGLATVSWRA